LQIFAAKLRFLKSSVVASLNDLETVKSDVQYIHIQDYHFDSNLKRMTSVYHDLESRNIVAFTKGAPESMIDACIYDSEGCLLTEGSKTKILRVMNDLASEGLVCNLSEIHHLINREF